MSFDCYGTLVDWRTGLTAALSRVAADRTEHLLLTALAHQFDLESGVPYRPYREILIEGLHRAAEQEGVEVSDPELFVHAWPGLPVFGDVRATLAALREAGWRLAVLTNCDDDLFALTAASLGIDLDEVVTAEQVGSYKPRRAHFEEFQRRTGATETGWVHVANSWVADIEPASRLGMPRIWVNRDGDGYDPGPATAVLPDFTGLHKKLEEVARSLS